MNSERIRRESKAQAYVWVGKCTVGNVCMYNTDQSQMTKPPPSWSTTDKPQRLKHISSLWTLQVVGGFPCSRKFQFFYEIGKGRENKSN